MSRDTNKELYWGTAYYAPEYPRHAEFCARAPGSRTSCMRQRETCSPGMQSPQRWARTPDPLTTSPESNLDTQQDSHLTRLYTQVYNSFIFIQLGSTFQKRQKDISVKDVVVVVETGEQGETIGVMPELLGPKMNSV